MEKKYWKGLDELSNDAEFVRLKNNEFYEHLPIEAPHPPEGGHALNMLLNNFSAHTPLRGDGRLFIFCRSGPVADAHNPHCPECVEVVKQSLFLGTFQEANAARMC